MKILRLSKKPSDNASSSSSFVKPKPPDPPAKATLDMTRSKFQKFVADWERHKKSCNIKEHFNIHIYNLCDESVQTIIHNTQPKFEEKTELEFLDILKKVVTEQANPRVHRCHFVKIAQTPSENMKSYATRLQTTAVECEFKCRVCKANIEEQFIEDQFINGMRDANILNIIATTIANILNIIATTGEHPKELIQGILNPIPKPGKEEGLVKNLRPITLLSVLRKILAKCLCTRKKT